MKVPASQSEAIEVTVTGGVTGWALKSGESYTGLTVSKYNAVLTITPTANTTTRDRTYTITLTDGSNNDLTTLQVIQSGVKVGTIALRCTDLEETETGSYSLAVEASGFPDEGQVQELNNYRKISVVATTKWEYSLSYPWTGQEGEGGATGTEWLSVYQSDEEDKGITENLGTHNGCFYLKANENTTGEVRTATVKVMDAVTYTVSATITVTQAAGSN